MASIQRSSKPAAHAIGAELFLTETQLAARQQRSVKTLRNLRVYGGPQSIPFVKIGRLVRYRLSDVEAWEKHRTRTSTSSEGSRNV